MKKDKIRILSLGLAVAGGLMMVSCGGGKSDNTLTLESYSYDTVGHIHPDSAESLEGYDPGFIQLSGRGVLPCRVGDSDISQLRDSLMRLANVKLEDGKAEAFPPRAITLGETPGKDDEVESTSFNNLMVVLATPSVVVWRDYAFQYISGAAHGRYATTYVNYSIADNRILSVADLMKPGYEESLLTMIKEKLGERDDVIVSLSEIAIPSNFEITDNGVVFVYGLYEVAPYSSGEVEVAFAAYELADILTPASMEMITGQRDED